MSTALSPGGSSGAAAVPVPGRPDPRILVDGAHGRHQRWWRPGERLEHLFEQRCEQLRAEGSADRLCVDAPGAALTYTAVDARAN